MLLFWVPFFWWLSSTPGNHKLFKIYICILILLEFLFSCHCYICQLLLPVEPDFLIWVAIFRTLICKLTADSPSFPEESLNKYLPRVGEKHELTKTFCPFNFGRFFGIFRERWEWCCKWYQCVWFAGSHRNRRFISIGGTIKVISLDKCSRK